MLITIIVTKRSMLVSVLFVFSASAMALAPSSSIWFLMFNIVMLVINEISKTEVEIGECCVCFQHFCDGFGSFNINFLF